MSKEQQIASEFVAKLKALLAEYGAELTAEDHYQGYPEDGEDVRMTVDINGVYDKQDADNHSYIRIDLGRYFDKDSTHDPWMA